MSIKVDIPSYLQQYTNDLATVGVNGSTVGECISHLITQFPAMEKMLFTKNGQLHGYVGIFINGENAYPDELAKTVKDGDELLLLYIIGGG